MFDKVPAPVRSSAKQHRARTDKHVNADKQGTQYVGDYFAASQYGGNAGGHSNTNITLPNSEGKCAHLLQQRVCFSIVYSTRRDSSQVP